MLVTSEYRAHYPYKDVVGVLTVCEGLTGSWIVPGKYYSDVECTQRTRAYVTTMSTAMGHCVGALTEKQWIVWGHFTYNSGTHGFCKSTAAKHLKAGNHVQACGQLMKWRFLTFPKYGRVDCAITANRKGPNRKNGCDGIMNRREFEYTMCMRAIE